MVFFVGLVVALCLFLSRRVPPSSTRPDPLFPYPTLFRSQREPVGARAEIDRARDGAVGNVEHVIARAETDIALDRGGGAFLDQELLDRRAVVVGGQVDRDRLRSGVGGRGADRARILDQRPPARAVVETGGHALDRQSVG